MVDDTTLLNDTQKSVPKTDTQTTESVFLVKGQWPKLNEKSTEIGSTCMFDEFNIWLNSFFFILMLCHDSSRINLYELNKMSKFIDFVTPFTSEGHNVVSKGSSWWMIQLY